MTNEAYKNNLFMNPALMQYNAVVNTESVNSDKLSEFKARIAPFEKVETLAEAKDLAARILPTANELNNFYIGDAKCTIVNKADMLRICIDSAEEFLCYDFS